LVLKEELLDRVWAGTQVTDGVLKVCVRELRKALRDDVKAPSFIETAHRRGYRFIWRAAAARRAAQPSISAGKRAIDGRAAGPGRAHRRARRRARAARDGARGGGLRRRAAACASCAARQGSARPPALDAFLRQGSGLDGAWIARGQCIEHYGSGEAYLPVLDALGRLLRSDVREPALRWIERDAPTWLAPLGCHARALRPRLARAPAARRDARTHAARDGRGARALSLETPLVLVLEDLHWSDFSTLDLLALLGRRREPARLLVLGTYRPGDVLRTSHPLKEVVGELDTHGLCERLELDTLPRPSIDDYLARRFAQHDFPRELADGLYRRTKAIRCSSPTWSISWWPRARSRNAAARGTSKANSSASRTSCPRRCDR
jgi:hypothetical protein